VRRVGEAHVKAAGFYGSGELVVEEVPMPAMADDELLVRVRAASICATDLRIVKAGHASIPEGTRRVLGHEVAGDVADIGPRVQGFTPGDRVSIVPCVGCGRCDDCIAGDNNACAFVQIFGMELDGGFQEYLRVPRSALERGNVVRVPDTVSYAQAALVEPMACCYRGQRLVGVGFRDTVVIIGAGPIGVLHTLLARLAGARRIIVADVLASRLATAHESGADVVVDGMSEDLRGAVLQETYGRGADVVITTVSSAAVQSQAVELLAPRGRLCLFAGLSASEHVEVDTNRVHYRSLTLTGTTGASIADYAACLRLVAERRIDLAPVITGRFPLDRIGEAIEHSASRKSLKAVVEFETPVAR
jgi:threonine dehydrogenase-like Zn-dependent dehydrogenase